MMVTELKHQCFFLSESDDDDRGLLYFPLARQQLIPWEKKDLDHLEAMLDDESEAIPEAIRAAVKASRAVFEDVRSNPLGTCGFEKLSRLSVIPGYACNFNCKYCYSRETRATAARLNPAVLRQGIRSFFEMTSSENVTVAFTGGGEPCLEADLLYEGTREAKKTAAAKRKNVTFTLTTNGALVDRNFLSFLKQNDYRVRVSFEIVPELQERQRGAWNAVHKNILLLMSEGIKTAVRSVVTPDSVHFIPQIVALSEQNYPSLEYLDIEPAFDPSCPPEDLKVFLFGFRKSLFETVKGRRGDLFPVNSLLLRIVGETGVCFCSGDYCILPEGEITWCHRVAASSKLYGEFIYGKLDETGIRLNREKYRDLCFYGSLFREGRCKECFARWNCSGGCALQNRLFGSEQRDVYCDFIKQTLVKYLFMKFYNRKTL